MREIGFIVWIWLLSIAPSFAQKQIKGKDKDMNGNPIAAANVSLKSNDSKILTFTKTDEKGFFWHAPSTKCQIDFVGEWSDLAEEIYNQ
jgi:hypothetical protein